MKLRDATDAVAEGARKIAPKHIYLDFQATTPVDPRVLEEMIPYFTRHYGNPHSRTHKYGWTAEQAVETAREQIARLIGAKAREIIFTSGATESNNIALKGFVRMNRTKDRDEIITTQVEHKSVLNTCRDLEKEGFRVKYLRTTREGLVDLEDLKRAITPQTLLVSAMAVNNEIGGINDIEEIGKICKDGKNVIFHTDIAQGFGKVPIDVEKAKIDLAAISGHKIYGPKGIGALYIRSKPRIRLQPIVSGGGQERGIRSGTVPTPLAVGLGKAAALAQEEMANDAAHLYALRRRFLDAVSQTIEKTLLNGPADEKKAVPGCVNLSFLGVEGESLLMAMKDFALSSGSACTSTSLEPSYVLRALGADEDAAHSSIRFGFGRFTLPEEVDSCALTLAEKVRRLREISPLWEMMKDGIDLKSINWTY